MATVSLGISYTNICSCIQCSSTSKEIILPFPSGNFVTSLSPKGARPDVGVAELSRQLLDGRSLISDYGGRSYLTPQGTDRPDALVCCVPVGFLCGLVEFRVVYQETVALSVTVLCVGGREGEGEESEGGRVERSVGERGVSEGEGE